MTGRSSLSSIVHTPPLFRETVLNQTGNGLSSLEEKRLEKACSEFESLFMNLVMKQMRKTVVKSGFIDGGMGEERLDEYRKQYERRKRFRLITFGTAIFLMIAVALLGFPTWEIFGLPKHVWAPYFYLLMFAHIIGIALTWRCPGCNSLLGDVFNTRFCSNCGLRFDSREGIE